MCTVTSVAGAAGAGAPSKAAPPSSSVAGASGSMPPMKMPCDEPGKGGGSDAVTGANAIGSSLQAALSALSEAVKQLAEVVARMAGTGKVAGVYGGAASQAQFVPRPIVTTVRSGATEDHEFEQRVLELINAERARHGLGAVRYSGVLDNASEKHARHMANVGKMAHDGIGDGTPGDRIRAEGFRNSWGENVATGQLSPEQVVREWMASPSHRRNILDANYTQMGVAYVTAANGRSYWAQSFGA